MVQRNQPRDALQQAPGGTSDSTFRYSEVDQISVTQHTQEGFHMNRKIIMAIMGGIMGLWLAAAQAATPDPQWLGTWEVDLSKSPPGPGVDTTQPAPKSVTYTFKDAGGGKWTVQPVIVHADGKKEEPPAATVSIDGTSTPISGNPGFDSVTVTFPDSRTEVATFLKAGKVVRKVTTKLSADGKQRSSSVESTDKDGKPVHTTEIWNKK
jgi:hypothetical protein